MKESNVDPNEMTPAERARVIACIAAHRPAACDAPTAVRSRSPGTSYPAASKPATCSSTKPEEPAVTPVDPYVLEVAAALTAAGLEVTETWTEATDPTDHNIAVRVRTSTLVLIWDTARSWVWIAYPSPSGTYSAAGTLFPDDGVRPAPAVVAAEVALLVARPIF